MSQLTLADHLARRVDNFLWLRIIAAIAVIYGHSFALVAPDGSRDVFLRMNWGYYSGDMAVFIFFVVSGFMVSGSYMARNNLADYLVARLLRIVPAFAFVLLACAFVLGPLVTRVDQATYWSSPQVIEYVTKNLKFGSDLAWHLPGVFETHANTGVNGSIWTLPAEIRMYMLVAILGAIGLLRAKTPAVVAVVALMLLGVFSVRFLPLHADWVRLAGYFCIGILAQLLKDRIKVSHQGMVMMVFAAYACSKTPAYPYVFALMLAYFSFWFAYELPVIGAPERFGDPSYGIYLWGWPIQQCLVEAFPAMPPWLNFVIATPIAITAGYVSWHVIEKNALKLKNIHLGAINAAKRLRTRSEQSP